MGEQCGSVGVFAEGTDRESANLPQKRQSSHSPTASPRILGEANQAKRENQSSSRADEVGVAIHSTKADSRSGYSASAECMDSKETSLNGERYPLFCDDFVGCQGGGEGIYLSGNEQAPAADSRKSAQKPTPKNKKLSYNEQRELDSLPDRIQSLEAQKQLIEQRLSDETSLARYGVVALAKELESITKELDSSYERYFFLEEKQESLKH
ncbi:ABC transporter C-terminal domain-containing protein [Helicobacter canis]|uniref:Putative amine oxidase n=1 Tax=Helicobacter canis TaxID=29419 RepID=A0A377J510_9HELI|nr:ABC transporter C-terminal domain-containing protein [Helicobacter canis]STO97385.1 putative amine oxidase [Helicobacter canis]